MDEINEQLSWKYVLASMWMYWLCLKCNDVNTMLQKELMSVTEDDRLEGNVRRQKNQDEDYQ